MSSATDQTPRARAGRSQRASLSLIAALLVALLGAFPASAAPASSEESSLPAVATRRPSSSAARASAGAAAGAADPTSAPRPSPLATVDAEDEEGGQPPLTASRTALYEVSRKGGKHKHGATGWSHKNKKDKDKKKKKKKKKKKEKEEKGDGDDGCACDCSAPEDTTAIVPAVPALPAAGGTVTLAALSADEAAELFNKTVDPNAPVVAGLVIGGPDNCLITAEFIFAAPRRNFAGPGDCPVLPDSSIKPGEGCTPECAAGISPKGPTVCLPGIFIPPFLQLVPPRLLVTECKKHCDATARLAADAIGLGDCLADQPSGTYCTPQCPRSGFIVGIKTLCVDGFLLPGVCIPCIPRNAPCLVGGLFEQGELCCEQVQPADRGGFGPFLVSKYKYCEAQTDGENIGGLFQFSPIGLC
jgi:hypothetical protein